MSASIEQIWNIVASRPKFVFSPTFIFCSPICSSNCGVWYFHGNDPLFYYLNLIPCRYWSWQRNIYFLVNIFVRHTFLMSTSSIKTKTVLTMTNMTQSTELQAFIRQKDGYKVTVKISLCICVFLSWDELKVRQNLLDSDYEKYMVRLLVATVNLHKSLQFVKNTNITLLPCLFMILLAVSINILRLGFTFWQELRFCVVFSPHSFIYIIS